MGFIGNVAFAVPVGYFLGLKQLIDKSDTIVILRIDKIDIPAEQAPEFGIYHCFIYQTLKGNIPPNKKIKLRLRDTTGSFETPFAIYSTHLAFLIKAIPEGGPTEYRVNDFMGSHIRLSPFGHEKMPEGKTLEEKIKNLIRKSIEYWDAENKKEKEFLESIIK